MSTGGDRWVGHTWSQDPALGSVFFECEECGSAYDMFRGKLLTGPAVCDGEHGRHVRLAAAFLGAAPKAQSERRCECGAQRASGVEAYTPGHSSWCPVVGR